MIKPIPNFDGYFIDDTGIVWCNLGRGNRRNNKTTELYQIKGRPSNNGYLRVYIRNTVTNKRVDRYIHRLVAEAFIPNPDNKLYVNHKDFDRQNNNVNNLEWCTCIENTSITEKVGHVIRDELGRFISNFDYESILGSKERLLNESLR